MHTKKWIAAALAVTESLMFTGKRVWVETFDWEPGVVLEKGAGMS